MDFEISNKCVEKKQVSSKDSVERCGDFHPHLKLTVPISEKKEETENEDA
jgi:hypothetical protein